MLNLHKPFTWVGKHDSSFLSIKSVLAERPSITRMREME